MKRRETARIARHDIGTTTEQQFYNVKLARKGGGDEGCCLITRPAINIRAICKFPLDRSAIANTYGCEETIIGSGKLRCQSQEY